MRASFLFSRLPRPGIGMLWTVLVFPLAAQVPPDPFAPTVTRKESELLSRVLSVMETNTVAAVTLLQEERPDDAGPATDFTLGNLYFQNGDLPRAESAYRAAVKAMPRFRSALMNLGRVLLLQDRPDETITVYQQLISDGQADADMLMLLGHALLMEDAPVGAETAYRQALLLRPKDTEIRVGLAKTLLRQERHREGLALIGELLNREPLNRELWSLRVNALLADDRTEEAITSLEMARRLDLASPDMLATLGDLWLHADRPEDALPIYRQAFQNQDPSPDRMLRALEGFLLVGDAEGAGAMVNRASEALDNEDNPDARHRLLRLRADLALLQNQPDAARTLLRDLLERDPLDGHALLTLSALQEQAGETEKALLTAERAARVEGFEADALLRQARIEVARKHYARAVPLLEAAQTFDPRDPVARYLEQVRRLAK